METEKITKKFQVNRRPIAPYKHIFQEEIYQSVSAIPAVFDGGAKFVSPHQVVLGGFDLAIDELIVV